MDAEANVHQQIGALSAKIDAAHRRLDDVQLDVRTDLSEIKADVKVLMENMNKGRGALALLMFLAGGTGAGLATLISFLAHK